MESFELILIKLAKYNKKIEAMEENGRFKLSWTAGKVPEATIEGMKEANKYLKIKDEKFKVTD